MVTPTQNSELFSKLLEKGITYSNYFFVINNLPDELMNYFFLRFYSNDNNIEQNKKNLSFFRFITVIAYINICMFFSRKSDMQNHFDSLMKQLQIKADKFFDDIDLDFCQTYSQLDNVLHYWNTKSVYVYHDLVSFIKRNMENVKIPYQTALGLWFVYNLNFTENVPTEEDIRKISPLLGSYAIIAAYQTRYIDFSNMFNKK